MHTALVGRAQYWSPTECCSLLYAFFMGTTCSLARDLEGRNPNSMADTLLLSQPYLEINLNSPLGIEFIHYFHYHVDTDILFLFLDYNIFT